MSRLSIIIDMATTTYDLEHVNYTDGWEIDGENIGYDQYRIDLVKGDTMVLNILGTSDPYVFRWRVSGINHSMFSNLNSPTINGPYNSETGTATLTLDTGSAVVPGEYDLISVSFRDSDETLYDVIDGEEVYARITLRVRFVDGAASFPDTDVTVTFSSTPAYGSGIPRILDADTTAFSVSIANGSSNTIYEVRSGHYNGTVLTSRTGSGTMNLISHIPSQGETIYYYVTGRRTVANGGDNNPYPIQNVPFRREYGPNAFGFKVFNSSGTLILDQSKRLPHLAATGTFTTTAYGSTYVQVNITGYDPSSDEWFVMAGPSGQWPSWGATWWVEKFTGYIRIHYEIGNYTYPISYWVYKL